MHVQGHKKSADDQKTDHDYIMLYNNNAHVCTLAHESGHHFVLQKKMVRSV